MGKFRKKPVEVEATQWFKNGDHPDDRVATVASSADGLPVSASVSEGKVVRRFNSWERPGTDLCQCGRPFMDHGWIDTLEGGHIVCPGDWIITGVAGERYPCKPNIFEGKYEPVRRSDLDLARAGRDGSIVLTDDSVRFTRDMFFADITAPNLAALLRVANGFDVHASGTITFSDQLVALSDKRDEHRSRAAKIARALRAKAALPPGNSDSPHPAWVEWRAAYRELDLDLRLVDSALDSMAAAELELAARLP